MSQIHLHWLFTLFSSLFIASFSDWYFFGVLFHDRYGKTPGVWKKYQTKQEEWQSIVIAQGIMSISNILFVMACIYFGLTGLGSATLAAFVLWLMIPLPILLTNAIFIPMDKLIVLSHSLGWLARLLLTAACIAIFL